MINRATRDFDALNLRGIINQSQNIPHILTGSSIYL